MNNFIWWTGYILAGLILGLFYYGGLWFTVRNLKKKAHPYFVIISSFFIRVIILMLILILVLQHSWLGLAGTLLGFFGMRVLITLKLKPA